MPRDFVTAPGLAAFSWSDKEIGGKASEISWAGLFINYGSILVVGRVRAQFKAEYIPNLQ